MDFDLGQMEQGVLGNFLFSLFLLAFVVWIAKKNGFFRLPPNTSANRVTLLHAVGIFSTYLFFAYIVIPLAVVIISALLTGKLDREIFLSLWRGWFQFGALSVLCLLLILYCSLLKRSVGRFIFWGEEEISLRRFWKSFGMGIVSWIVSYPFVLLTGVITNWLALQFWGTTHVEQVAVRELKMMLGHPALLTVMVFVVVMLVPFMEELLFRGFLQNLLKGYLGRGWAIVLTALIFAAVHFSLSQGYGNFQLITSLAILALFLGFIYEKERTLWAPIGLHFSFNACNVLIIIFGK